MPVAGEQHLAKPRRFAAAKSPNFLFDELKERIAKAPVAFRLLVQLANPGDPTSDATTVWPDDLQKVRIRNHQTDFR